jgi:predicted RNase H-like nuclease (RuvC/YqgF family)
MNYSYLYKNYKNTILYLLFGIFAIIILTQFDYIKKSIIEGFNYTEVKNVIQKLRDEIKQLGIDTAAIQTQTKTMNTEIENIGKNITKLREETTVLDNDRQKIEAETAALKAEYDADNQA